MIRIEAVSKKYPSGVYGVRDLSFTIPSGVLGLLGPNGAGKTTLMQMIATITKPSSGQIFFQDKDIAKDPEFVRKRLGYLPQDFGVYDNLTAAEFLSYFGALKGVHPLVKRPLGGSGGLQSGFCCPRRHLEPSLAPSTSARNRNTANSPVAQVEVELY